MTCARYKELISRYVDGEVTPRQRREVLAHVEHCHDCAAWLARARQAEVLLIRGVPETQPSDRVRNAVLGAASHTKSTKKAPTHSAHPRMGEGWRFYTAGLLLRYDTSPQRIALAAAVALFSIIGLAYWLNMLPPLWGYKQFGFQFVKEQAQASLTNTPIPAISSGFGGVGGQMAAPNLLRISPADGTEEVKPNTALRVGFDLPMDRASVEDAIRIDPPAAGAFKWNYDNEVNFTPTGAGLLRGVTYTVSLSDTARSLAGTRIGKPASWSFHTHRTYSVIPVIPPGSSAPITGSLKLIFELPMDTAQAARAVSLRAEDTAENIIASYAWDSTGEELTIIPIQLMPNQVVTLRVGADATTRSGDTLGRSVEFTYTAALPDPTLRLAKGRLAIAQSDSPLPLSYEAITSATSEISQVKFKVYNLPGEQLSVLGAQAHDWPLGLPAGLPGSLSSANNLATRHVEQPTNPEAGAVELTGDLPGTYLVVANAQSQASALTDWQLLIIANRHITRVGDNAPFWITDEAGRPWAGAEVSLYSPSGTLLEKGLTDESGLWVASAARSNATLAIARDPYGNVAAMILAPKQQKPAVDKSALAATLQTDQPAYYPGQAITFHAVAHSGPTASLDSDNGVSASLFNPQGLIVSTLSLKPDSTGGVTGLFSLAPSLRPGQYTLRIGSADAWRDFPLAVVAPRNDTLSLYVAPAQENASDTQVLTYTASVLGPTGEPAVNANLTGTLRISGDDWASSPVNAVTQVDGRAIITVSLPVWSALYKDPTMYLDIEAAWQGKSGSSQVPLDLTPLRPLLSGVGSLASPSLDIAAVTEPQKDGSTRLRLVTLVGGAQAKSGDVLVQAEAPSGERQSWAIDLAGSGGDITLPLPSIFAGGKVSFLRAGVDGARQMALPLAQSADLSLSVVAPDTTIPGAILPLALKLTGKDGQGVGGMASIWFRRASDDAQPTERGWEPSANIDASGTLTAAVIAPTSPGLWYSYVEAATAEGPYTLSRAVVRVLPGPVIQTPPAQQLESGATQAVSVSIYNPLDAPLSTNVRAEGNNSLEIAGSSPQSVEVAAGGWQRLTWSFIARQLGTADLTFSFSPGAGVGGKWGLRTEASENTHADINYAAGALTGQRTVGVLVPSGLPPDSVQLEIRASTSLLSALADAANNLPTQSGAGDAGLWAAQLSAAPSVASAYQRIGSSGPARVLTSGVARSLALQQLYASQHADGGWGKSMDPSEGPSDIGKTTDVMLAMRRQSLAWAEVGNEPEPGIDSSVTSRALSYLSWQSARPVGEHTNVAMLDEQARALYALSLYGAAKAETMRPLMVYTQSDRDLEGTRLSRAGAAWLALALWQANDTGDALALINRLTLAQPDAKDMASIPLLEALVAASNTVWQSGDNTPDTSAYKAKAGEYAHNLMEMRQGPLWSSPSISADALWALSRYAPQEPAESVGLPSITLNDSTVQASPQFDNTSTSALILSGDLLHAGTNWLKLQAPASQPLYYSLTLRASR